MNQGLAQQALKTDAFYIFINRMSQFSLIKMIIFLFFWSKSNLTRKDFCLSLKSNCQIMLNLLEFLRHSVVIDTIFWLPFILRILISIITCYYKNLVETKNTNVLSRRIGFSVNATYRSKFTPTIKNFNLLLYKKTFNSVK